MFKWVKLLSKIKQLKQGLKRAKTDAAVAENTAENLRNGFDAMAE